MDSRHHKILQYLIRYGTHVEMDITPVLRELYPGVDRMDHKRVVQESRNIHRLLSDMQQDDLIRFKRSAIGTGDKHTGLAWIDITPVYASITEKGKIMLGQPVPQRVTNVHSPTQHPLQPQRQYQPTKTSTYKESNSVIKSILTAISFAFLIGSAIEMCKGDSEREKLMPVRTNSSPEDEKRIRAEFDKIKRSIQRNRDSLKRDSLNRDLSE